MSKSGTKPVKIIWVL